VWINSFSLGDSSASLICGVRRHRNPHRMTQERSEPQRKGTGLAFRLILSAFAALFGVMMLLIAPSAAKPLGHYIFGAFCLSIAAVCFTSGRVQQFIGSAIASAVVAVTVWYLVSELTGGPLFSGSRAEPSVINAIFALVAFGGPAAAYLMKARFGFGAQDQVMRSGSDGA